MGVAKTIAPGTVFGGDYEIERTLAAGGMGAVYVARQRSTQKLRAIKTLLPEYVADPTMRARFAREAVAGSQIESDHIVEVLAAGVDEPSGTPWIAMEFLAGADLADTVKKGGALPTADVVEVIRQLGHALTAAHRVGVVHRDLKPENIFLATARREGAAFTVKVLDFGIAKLVHAARTHVTTSAMGSPLWMAPEQTDSSLAITPATDVWALGLITFWLLTGTHYWHTPRMPDGTIGAMIRELLTEPLATASARAAEFGVAQRIPPGFDGWFARAVVRDGVARFRDAGEAIPALLSVLGAAQNIAGYVPATASSPMAVLSPTAPLLGAPQVLPSTMAAPPQTLAGAASQAVAPVVHGAPPNAYAPHPMGPQPPAAPRSKAPVIVGAAVVAAVVVAVGAWSLVGRDTSSTTPPTVHAQDAAAPSLDAAVPSQVAMEDPGTTAQPTPGTPVVVRGPGRQDVPPGVDAPVVQVEPPPDAAAPPDVAPPPPDAAVAPDVAPPPPDVAPPPPDVALPPPDVAPPPPPPDVAAPPPPPDVAQPSRERCGGNSCSSCLAEEGCGWCGNSHRCVPGSWASAENGECSGTQYIGDRARCDDRCERRTSCSTCLAEEGCGWCGNLRRCVAGNWASATNGACSGSQYIGDGAQCDDRCERRTSCGACIAEDGCGWCSNLNRCVSGTWAHPNHGACSGSQWVGSGGTCP